MNRQFLKLSIIFLILVVCQALPVSYQKSDHDQGHAPPIPTLQALVEFALIVNRKQMPGTSCWLKMQ